MRTNRHILFSVKCIVSVITILELISSSSGQWAVDDDGCRTPGAGVGSCILLRKCEPIMNIIELIDAITENIALTLRSYHCGFQGREIKVCCPYSPIDMENFIGKELTPSPPKDYQNHRNAKLLPEDCGLIKSMNRIYGGNKAALFEFPHMALLSYNTGDSIDFRCAGSIINDLYILTAAHCITNLGTTTLIGVRVGEYDIGSVIDCSQILPGVTICAEPVQDIAIAETIPHPDYNSHTYVNDIGLIRLKRKINMSVDSVSPICLPMREDVVDPDLVGQKLTVTGWGITERGKKSEVLMKVFVPVLNQENCLNAYNNTNVKITENHICAGGERADSCSGDSGGPLETDVTVKNDRVYVQHGIVSFGPRFCGIRNLPGVYTKVAKYLPWILETIRP